MYPETFHQANRGLSPRKERGKEPTEFPLVYLPCSSLSGRGSLKLSKGYERGTADLQFLRVPSSGCSAGKEEKQT